MAWEVISFRMEDALAQVIKISHINAIKYYVSKINLIKITLGDVSKAFGAGADFVMIGGMLAGHDESGGDIIEKNGRKMKLFYGMASSTAMEKHQGGVAEYRASEGKTVEIEYRGPVANTIQDILGGVRSTCTYVGASKLKELSKRTTFIRVSQQLNEVYSAFQVRN